MKEQNFSPRESKSEKDYSIFLEAAQKEEKKKEKLGERISERIKFLEIERVHLELLKEDPNTPPEKVKELEEKLDAIHSEILKLAKEKQKIETDIALHRNTDKWAKSLLEEFESNSEH
jgi:DNA-nicking Smr family endonuclease